jgi:chromosome segregation ATPase
MAGVEEDQNKLPLSKAKDSRDELAQNIKSLESSLEKLDGAKTETIDSNTNHVAKPADIAEENGNAILSENFDTNDSIIVEKRKELTRIEEKLLHVKESYDHKTRDRDSLEAELKILKSNKESTEENYNNLGKKMADLSQDVQAKQMELMVISESLKQRERESEELTVFCENLKRSNQDQEQVMKEQNAFVQQMHSSRLQLEIDLRRSRETLEESQDSIQKLDSARKNKENELKGMQSVQERLTKEIALLQTTLARNAEEMAEKEKQQSILLATINAYDAQLSETVAKLTEHENRLVDAKNKIENLNEEAKNQQSLIKIKDQRADELKNLVDKKNLEYETQVKQLTEIEQKIKGYNEKYENLVKVNESIDKVIGDSKARVDELKKELEFQEKSLQEKEKNMHRIEVLTFLFRMVKFVSGAMMAIGGIFIIIGLSYVLGIVDLGGLNRDLIIYLTFIGGIFLMVSGIFQLERRS